ncbi:hypothetical protein BCR34DRAFT_475514 [Clohesyomyces aquaticus]|uniref:Uncharacterized protein n=1 Tax=Clohesyomyces aquaticus TaxID=1231657 RepID=A0A1Y2A3E1_9PLEO|nr:hypothetical protein BCR34DRAFT_475514 [Clohesyomyces aquaticus]
MSFLSKLTGCLCIAPPHSRSRSPSEKLALITNSPYTDHPTASEVAEKIIHKLYTTPTNNAALRADLKSTMHTYGWYDNLATAILCALESALKVGKDMGPAMKEAYDKAVAMVNKVEEWAHANPEMAGVMLTLIALGVLAVLMPWVMAYLGFAEEGIVEASWAARWQSTFQGFVPKGSLFSYLQSLGTKIGRKWVG